MIRHVDAGFTCLKNPLAEATTIDHNKTILNTHAKAIINTKTNMITRQLMPTLTLLPVLGCC